MSLFNRYTLTAALIAGGSYVGYQYLYQTTPHVLKMGQLYRCTAVGYNGYLRPIEDGKKAEFYTDGQEVLVCPKTVEFLSDRKKTYIKVDEGDNIVCELKPFLALTPSEVPEGNNFTQPRYEVKTTPGVAYATVHGYWSSYPENFKPFSEILVEKASELFHTNPLDLTMDIYEPEDGHRFPRPLVMMVHGGAFYNGDKRDEEYVTWCRDLASYGYTAVSVNYRLGFVTIKGEVERAAYRAIQDIHAATRFMLAHKDSYFIDPDRVYLAGCSAGAIAALHVAFLDNDSRPLSTYGSWFNDDMGTINSVPVEPAYHEPLRIRGICNMWGAVFSTDILRTGMTNVLSIHDMLDPIVPYSYGVPFTEVFDKEFEDSKDPAEKKEQGFLASITNKAKNAYDYFFNRTAKEIATKIIPEVYGSSNIEAFLDSIRPDLKHKFVSTNLGRHTIIRDGDNIIDKNQMDECTKQMVRFFRDIMIDRRAKLSQGDREPRLFSIENADDVEACSWEVEGGIITDQIDATHVQVLFFDDQSGDPISIRVKGIYRNGIPFEDRRVIRQ